jgi:5,10-methylenetetrahydromethanopterin reductase
MKLGIAFVPDYVDLSILPEYAKSVESCGFHSLWIPEHFMHGEVFTLLGAAAVCTEKILLGTGIVCLPVRHPALTAMAASTLHKISRGRVVLGIGLGDESLMQNSLGIDTSKPLTLLQDAIAVIKTVFKGCGDYNGKIYRAIGLRCPPLENPPRVLIAAVGQKALRLAGQFADGVILTAFTTTEYIQHAVKTVREACLEHGRDPSELEYAAMVAAATEYQRQELKKLAATFLSLARRAETVLTKEQLEGLDLPTLRRLIALGEHNKVLEILDDRIVEEIAAVGNFNSIRLKLEKLTAAGITFPIPYPVGNPHPFLTQNFTKTIIKH